MKKIRIVFIITVKYYLKKLFLIKVILTIKEYVA